MQNVSSQSTKTGFAPNSAIAPTVATNVFAVVITSSPNSTPTYLSESLIASVPEFTPTAYSAPISLANSFSNFLSGSPSVKSPPETKCFNCSHKFSQFLNC